MSTAKHPSSEKTPGVADPRVASESVLATICSASWSQASQGHKLSKATKARVFHRYHVKKSDRRKYVIDRRVPLEVGGSNAVDNLWPQRIKAAAKKNRREKALHAAVCAGTVTLAAAQRQFAPHGKLLAAVVTTTTTIPPTTTTTVYVPPPPPPPPPTSPPATAAPAPPPQPSCPNGGYTNVDGNYVCSPYTPPGGGAPAGASAKCNDGSYSFSQHRSGTCSGHGGVAQWL